MFEDNALERGEVALHELEGPQFVPALRYEPDAEARKQDVTGINLAQPASAATAARAEAKGVSRRS
jgi:hypothetical protein